MNLLRIRPSATPLLLALALTTGMPAMAQAPAAAAPTLEQSLAASRAGNYAAAFAGFQKLAAQNNAAAQYNLGVMYEQGHGMAKNEQLATGWYYKAAQLGHMPSQLKVGLAYDLGKGVVQNKQQAAAKVVRLGIIR